MKVEARKTGERICPPLVGPSPAFPSGLITYVRNSGGSGQEGIARRLKSTAALSGEAAQSCRDALWFKGMEGTAPGSVRHQEMTPALLPAAVCCDSQGPAGLRHLASPRIPRTHIGNPNLPASRFPARLHFIAALAQVEGVCRTSDPSCPFPL